MRRDVNQDRHQVVLDAGPEGRGLDLLRSTSLLVLFLRPIVLIFVPRRTQSTSALTGAVLSSSRPSPCSGSTGARTFQCRLLCVKVTHLLCKLGTQAVEHPTVLNINRVGFAFNGLREQH